MFPKLLVIIIVLGITGCLLLVNRQQQIEAAHEMTVIHQRLADHEQTIWKLRAEVARRCSPDQLHLLQQELGEEWSPLLLPISDADSPPSGSPDETEKWDQGGAANVG